MSRARTFTKAELLDAARAAAETGLSARLHPSGEIEFYREQNRRRKSDPPSPDDLLREWLDENEVGRRA